MSFSVIISSKIKDNILYEITRIVHDCIYLNCYNIAELLLNSCSYLASKDIPILFLESWLVDLTSEPESSLISYMLDEYIGQLVRYSLVERSGQKNTISIHRLVQEVLRYKKTRDEKQLLLKNMCFMLNCFININDGLVIFLNKMLLPHAESLYQHCQSLHDFSKTDSKEKANMILETLPRGLGKLYHEFGLAKEGFDFLSTALRIIKIFYGENHIETARTQDSLANFIEQLGDHREAYKLRSEALNIEKKHYGTENHISVAETQHNLATLLEKLGDYFQAEKLHRHALATKIIYYKTESHISIAMTQVNLGNVLERLGEYTEAEVLYRQALKIEVAYYKTENHIRIAETLVSLATILQRLDNCHEALKLCNKALVIKIAHYETENHINVAITKHTLAGILVELGDYFQAKKLLNEVLKIKIKHYGRENHISVAETQQNLAIALGRLNDNTEAEILYRQALENKISHYKTESHIRVAEVQEALANFLVKLGKYPEAISLYYQVLNTQKACYKNQNHICIANVQHNLAVALEKNDNYPQAEGFYNQALKSKIIYYKTERHIDVVQTQQKLANLLKNSGDYQQAMKLFRQALEVSIEHYQTDKHINVAVVQHHFALLLFDLGELNQANLLCQTCEEVFQTQNGGEQYLPNCRQFKENIMEASSLKEKASTALKLEDYVKAASLFDDLIDICRADMYSYYEAGQIYSILSKEKNLTSYLAKAEEYFHLSLNLVNHMNTQIDYANFLRLRGSYFFALNLLDNLLVQNVAESLGKLSYGISEARKLPYDLAEKIHTDGAITISNPIFYIHYLKIVCLLEKQDFEPTVISTNLKVFTDYTNAFKASTPEDFPHIYDWLLQNATDLIRKKLSAICIQGFFRNIVTKKNLNPNEIRVNP